MHACPRHCSACLSSHYDSGEIAQEANHTVEGVLQQQKDEARQPLPSVMRKTSSLHVAHVQCCVAEQAQQGPPKCLQHLRAVHLQERHMCGRFSQLCLASQEMLAHELAAT